MLAWKLVSWLGIALKLSKHRLSKCFNTVDWNKCQRLSTTAYKSQQRTKGKSAIFFKTFLEIDIRIASHARHTLLPAELGKKDCVTSLAKECLVFAIIQVVYARDMVAPQKNRLIAQFFVLPIVANMFNLNQYIIHMVHTRILVVSKIGKKETRFNGRPWRSAKRSRVSGWWDWHPIGTRHWQGNYP